MNNPWKEETFCRACNEETLVHILDLGSMPPANAFLTGEDLEKEEPSFPLRVAVCFNCLTVQLQDTIDPEALFSRDYYYFTGASAPLVKHFQDFGKRVAEDFGLTKEDLVVEMGSNDGVLLGAIAPYARVLGVDPATNVAEAASQRGIKTVTAFFSEETAKQIRAEEGPAKIILANNVFAHIPAIHDVVRGVKELLSDDGTFIAENHWVGNLIGDGGYDQIYHEHIHYFSLHALKYLFEVVHGLTVSKVELIPIHGESLRIFVTKEKAVDPSVAEFLEKEKSLKLDELEAYLAFGTSVRKTKDDLLETLGKIKREGKRIVGYGAPAKGNTLLNFSGIGPDILDYIIDTTPTKQGTYTPGMRIKVVPPDALQSSPPDYILLLSWNYADAILEKEKELRARGVKFIIPVPVVRIV